MAGDSTDRTPLADRARLLSPRELRDVGSLSVDWATAFRAELPIKKLAAGTDGVPGGDLLLGAAWRAGGDVLHRRGGEVADPLE